MRPYSGQKAYHFLKEAICFKLQRSFPYLKQITFIHKLQFSSQTKYNFVQDQAWVQEVPPESWILNLESRKVCKVCIFLGKCLRVCICTCLLAFVDSTHMPMYLNMYIYIYTYMVPPFTINCSIIIPNHKTGQKWWIFGGVPYICMYIYISAQFTGPSINWGWNNEVTIHVDRLLLCRVALHCWVFNRLGKNRVCQVTSFTWNEELSANS